MESPDDERVTTPRAVALLDDAHLPQARARPQDPLTLEDVLSAALDHLEDFLLDIYEHGRSIGDPHVLWANGAPTTLREALDCERLTVG
jgi:hypothetical protein